MKVKMTTKLPVSVERYNNEYLFVQVDGTVEDRNELIENFGVASCLSALTKSAILDHIGYDGCLKHWTDKMENIRGKNG